MEAGNADAAESADAAKSGKESGADTAVGVLGSCILRRHFSTADTGLEQSMRRSGENCRDDPGNDPLFADPVPLFLLSCSILIGYFCGHAE